MSLLVKAKGINKLSQLQIDCDKDWGGKGITNIRQIADGMGIGSLVQHNGTILENILPGSAHYVLTSDGQGKKVVWEPGGLFFNRTFPVLVGLSRSGGVFSPDSAALINSPLGMQIITGAPYSQELDRALSLALARGIFAPDAVKTITPSLASGRNIQIPPTAALLNKGGVFTDFSAAQISGYTRDQFYLNGDNTDKSFSGSSWESQTFTAAVTGQLRFVTLKLWQPLNSMPGLVTVSIRAVDGSGHPTGADLAVTTFNGNALPYLVSPGNLFRVNFPSPANVVLGTKYAILIRAVSGGLNWRANSAGAYAGGNREYSTNGGVTWSTDSASDYLFEVWYTINDVKLLSDTPLAVGDAFYWGFDSLFDAIVQDIGVAGVGTYVLAYEYSRVADFNPCVGLVDGTNQFQTLYSNPINFTRQGDWATQSVNGISKYWVRARVTDAGSGYNQPMGTFAILQINV